METDEEVREVSLMRSMFELILEGCVEVLQGRQGEV